MTHEKRTLIDDDTKDERFYLTLAGANENILCVCVWKNQINKHINFEIAIELHEERFPDVE